MSAVPRVAVAVAEILRVSVLVPVVSGVRRCRSGACPGQCPVPVHHSAPSDSDVLQLGPPRLQDPVEGCLAAEHVGGGGGGAQALGGLWKGKVSERVRNLRNMRKRRKNVKENAEKGRAGANKTHHGDIRLHSPDFELAHEPDEWHRGHRDGDQAEGDEQGPSGVGHIVLVSLEGG